MRLFVAGLQHESSSFSPIPTSMASFTVVHWGVDPADHVRGFGYGEACDRAVALGWEVVAGPHALAQPSLPVSAAGWQSLREGILTALAAAGPVDAVLLCLHGAQMADGVDDCEGEILDAVRAAVGDRVAIGALLDLHANISSRMLDAADLVVSCREYPHIDYDQRAGEMLPVLAAIAAGIAQPNTAAVRICAPGVYPTPDEPMRSFVARITAEQARPGVLMVSANHGFEGSDQPDTAASIVVTTDDDVAAAERIAAQLGAELLELVGSHGWGAPGVAEALDVALAVPRGPVVLADRSDNAGGGAAGDSTFVLAELLRRGVGDVALALLWDPVAVDWCHAAGVGARLPLRIGGKSGPMSGDPLDVVAEVRCLRTDARQAVFGKGEPNAPLGRSAAIRVDGIDVVLNTFRQQVFSRHCFSAHDIDPLSTRLLVVKSTQHFMNDFGPLASEVVRCDPPGTMTSDLASLPYRRVRRPMLGLDPIDTITVEPFPRVRTRQR